jgi:hypothetical protein
VTARSIRRSVRAKYQALNDATPGITSCAWPDCRERMQEPLPSGTIERRIGILCWTHADAVTDAVLQQRVMAADHKHHDLNSEYDAQLARETEARERREAEEARMRAELGGHLGFVYYLRVGERVKIGFSTDVKRRMRQYPPGSQLLAVEPGDYGIELRRHRQFSGSRTDGREWFRPTPDLLEHIATMVASHGEPKRYAHHFRKSEGHPVTVSRSA